MLGRIDAIVPFQPLSRETQRNIVVGKLTDFVQEVLSKHGTRVLVAPRVIEYLIEDKADTDAEAGGARAAIARLTDDVVTAVAAFINEHPGERALQVNVEGVLTSEDKTLLKSRARITVALPTS